MSGAVRLYRLLLHAYPPAFRAAYGGDMQQLFRDQWRDHLRTTSANRGMRTVVGFWATVLWDLARSAPALRLEAVRVRRRRGAHIQLQEDTMTAKWIVMVLAIAAGAFEIVNTVAEVSAHGADRASVGWMLAMAVSVVFGVLLATSGAAMLRRGALAARVARGAALGCLMLIVGLQLVFPFMSIFSRLLGLAIPIAVLLVTSRPRGTPGRDPSVPTVA